MCLIVGIWLIRDALGKDPVEFGNGDEADWVVTVLMRGIVDYLDSIAR